MRAIDTKKIISNYQVRDEYASKIGSDIQVNKIDVELNESAESNQEYDSPDFPNFQDDKMYLSDNASPLTTHNGETNQKLPIDKQ